MEFFLKLKQWAIDSSWIPWAIGGFCIIVSLVLYREMQVERIATAELKQILNTIQSADRDMQETKYQVQEQNITKDTALDESAKNNQKNVKAGKSAFSDLHEAMSHRMKFERVKSSDPYIPEKGAHTVEDVKVMRLALEGTLNKLMTLRREDIVAEYIDLQKQFAALLMEVFVDKKSEGERGKDA